MNREPTVISWVGYMILLAIFGFIQNTTEPTLPAWAGTVIDALPWLVGVCLMLWNRRKVFSPATVYRLTGGRHGAPSSLGSPNYP